MDVVDNTVLIDCWAGQSEFAERSIELLSSQEKWFAPDLWRYEFGNVINKLARLGHISEDLKYMAWNATLEIIETIHQVDVLAVDEVAIESGLKFYDASYVWLAREVDGLLYTRDAQILSSCPDVARGLAI